MGDTPNTYKINQLIDVEMQKLRFTSENDATDETPRFCDSSRHVCFTQPLPNQAFPSQALGEVPQGFPRLFPGKR